MLLTEREYALWAIYVNYISSYNQINCSEMKIKNLAQLLKNKAVTLMSNANRVREGYRPTPYLSHPFLQSVYNITEPLFPYAFQR